MAASLRQAAPVLEVRDLRKSFTIHALGRHVEALAGVDLVVRAGEHVALVGPSGAGKSTLLKCVWRSCRPTSGAVWLRRADGTVVDLAVAEDRQVAELRGEELGYVSQLLRSEQRPSVVDVVRRAAIRRGVEANEASRVAEAALQRVALDRELWDTHPVLLSGGERQRVNLAVGTVVPPAMLLLDEPVASLDARNREAVLGLIQDLAGAGVAVLSVFHDLDAVRALATRVVVLEGGRVANEGPPERVLASLVVPS